MVTIRIGDHLWYADCSLEKIKELQKEYCQKKQLVDSDGERLDYIKFNGKEPDTFEFVVWLKVVHQIDAYYVAEGETYCLPWKDVKINA